MIMMLRKIFLVIPVAMLISCGGGANASAEGEGEGEAKAEAKAENAIIICSKEGKDEKVLKTITGAETADYLIGLETLVHVKVTFKGDIQITNEQVLECLKKTTFTNDGFSPSSSEECLEEASGAKLMASSGKNKRTIKGKEVFTYNLTFKKSN
jgi:hypothetical protein